MVVPQYLSLWFFGLLFVAGVSCHKKGEPEVKPAAETEVLPAAETYYYTCPMHPQVKEPQAGKCPICLMNLTKVLTSTDSGAQSSQDQGWHCRDYPEITSSKEEICPIDGSVMLAIPAKQSPSEIVAKVRLRKSQLQHFRPDYYPATTMKMRKSIHLLGTVKESEDKVSAMPARVPGRVEKVYVSSTQAPIKKGDPVVDYYSPQLSSGVEEYILVRRSYEQTKNPEFLRLVSQGEDRLTLWGVTRSQLDSWYASKKVPPAITLHAPSSGTVQKRNAVAGKYFQEGEMLLEISDLNSLWVEMDVYEPDVSLVKVGQEVTLHFTSLPGERYLGAIEFINAIMDPNSRTLKIRTTINNSDKRLRPGMTGEGHVFVEIPNSRLVVPRTAILDNGKSKVVWTKVAPEQFQAKLVETGLEAEGYVEIKAGLMEGEEVVIEGNFLLDSQAQLFGGYEMRSDSPASQVPHHD